MSTYGKSLWFLAIGASQLGFLVAGGLLGGLWLDRKWHTSPWLGLIGLILGFSAGVQFLIRLVQLSKQKQEKE